MPGDQPRFAGVGWAGDEGKWVLLLAHADLSGTSPLAASWPDLSGPPSLMDRYDALASLGYAVAHGGPEAWTWTETTDEDGRTYLLAWTEVRPLRADELPAATDPTDT